MLEIVTFSLNQDLSIWCIAHSVAKLRRMLTLISNIFWRFAVHLPFIELIRIWYDFIFFDSHFWRRQRNGSMQIGKSCQSGRNVSMHFSPSSFRWVKPMPFRIRYQAFNSSQKRPLVRHGNTSRIISLCVHTT
jgi:hypothetical protein